MERTLLGTAALAAPASAWAATAGRGLPWWAWLTLLPPLLALGLGLHATASAACKQLLLRCAPLARGEQRIAGYERGVHDSVEREMQAVVALALAGGAALWVAAWSAAVPAWAAAVLLLLAALALDLVCWQRVEVGAEHVWFQRGLTGTVHQVLIENVRDAGVDHLPAHGVSLRHGVRDNATVRLKLRMKDRHVAALPKAGPGAIDAVEAVAARIDERLRSLRAERAVRRRDPERDLVRALRRLRRIADAQAA
jgi:hypothetical protein